jgi:hypothetical protein
VNDIRSAQLTNLLLKELPFYNINVTYESSFNNSITTNLPTLKDLDKYPSMRDLGLFNLNTDSDATADINSNYGISQSQYYSPHKFTSLKSQINSNIDASFSLLHNNVRSLRRNLENFQTHLLQQLDYNFSVIGISETKIRDDTFSDFNPDIANYTGCIKKSKTILKLLSIPQLCS